MSPDSHELLVERAEGTKSDLEAQARADGHDWDTGYDLWIEWMDGRTVGVIDFGDLYQGTFIFDEGQWHDAMAEYPSPSTLIDRIIRKRRFTW